MRKLWENVRIRAAIIALGAVALIVGAAVITYMLFSPKVLPGTSVAGTDVSGLTQQQLKQQLDEAAALPVIITVAEQSVSVPRADLGVNFDADTVVQEVFAPNQTFWGTLTGLFGSREVALPVTVDQEKVNKVGSELPLSAEQHVQNAEVVAEGDTFTVTPGAPGQTVDTQALAQSLAESSTSLSQVKLSAQLVEALPEITTEAAQEAANTANAWVATEVTLSDGEWETLTADTALKASWISFAPSPDQGALTPSVDAAAVKEWVNQFAEDTAIKPTDGIRNLDEAGNVVATVIQPKSGWVASNTDAVTEAVIAGMAAGTPVLATLDYVEQEGGWEERQADPATAGLLYRAAPGEKWIDLNLTDATVTAYEGAKVVAGPFLMVPGAPETPTVEGEFNVYLKYEIQTMRGLNADGTKYETPDVPWVTYFEGGYGFHGAPWRSTFGWNGPGGSHGCINMPVEEALFIYNWADMGTKVISHS